MTYRLISAREAPAYRAQILDMMEEWLATGEKIVPYAIRRQDVHDFPAWCASLDQTSPSPERVPDTTFLCLEEESGQMVGAINIRHRLNDSLLLNGGHIGDGVRPSRRCEGIGTRMIAMALEECRTMGIRQVLMVCDRDNAASRKTILRNGGVLENEVLVDGVWEQRYWIDLAQG